jgi:hypothetical protein
MRIPRPGAAAAWQQCSALPDSVPLIVDYFASALALAFAASHSDLDIDTQPMPLQLFIPLQLFLADLHSEVPLQELTPEQCTAAASAATDTPVSPDVKNIAAAAAIAAFDNLVICILEPSFVIRHGGIAVSCT